MKRTYLFFTIFIFAFILNNLSHAQPSEPFNDDTSQLQVGTKESPPFAMKDNDGNWSGISIELWSRIAEDLGINYQINEFNLENLMQEIRENSIDIAVGSLSITADREQVMDFTHPFYSSGLAVAVKGDTSDWLFVMSRIFSAEFLSVLATLALLLLVVGFLVWIFERKQNEAEFGGSNLDGIFSGFWWSAVTMTTVGYGDKSPVTLGGRIIALIWMFAGIIAISGITASITSALTVGQLQSSIQSPADLRKVVVGTVPDSTSANYLESHRVRSQNYDDVTTALDALSKGSIDAVVYDEPILRYWVLNHPTDETLKVLPFTFVRQDYGFALPSKNQLREDINIAMLQIITSEEWKDYLDTQLGKSE